MEKKLFLGRIRACIAKHKAKKKRQLLIKIRTLYQASYDFYLALYLIDVEKNKKHKL